MQINKLIKNATLCCQPNSRIWSTITMHNARRFKSSMARTYLILNLLSSANSNFINMLSGGMLIGGLPPRLCPIMKTRVAAVKK